jgi:hypothetical protein
VHKPPHPHTRGRLPKNNNKPKQGLKCDIEALDAAVGGVGGLGDALARRIVRGQYL